MSTTPSVQPGFHGRNSQVIDQSHATCMNGDPHDPHVWHYTSDDGGHMLAAEFVEADIAEGRDVRRRECPGRPIHQHGFICREDDHGAESLADTAAFSAAGRKATGLVDQAALVRKRIRRDGLIDSFGVDVYAHLAWRIGNGILRTTSTAAVVAASRRIRNTADGQTVVDGEIVNESDLIALVSQVKRSADTGVRVCFVCYSAPVHRGGLCLTDYRTETGDN